MSSDPSPLRSVLHFKSEDEVRKALLTPVSTGADSNDTTKPPGPPPQPNGSKNGAMPRGYTNGRNHKQQLPPAELTDWMLECFDEHNSEVQSLEEEVQRLQVLRSYQALEMEPDGNFDRIADMAARYFGIEIALITLFDMGRQWVLSNHGMQGLVELPRKKAMCAHTLISKTSMLVAGDVTEDFRFRNHPAVTGPPYLRFYAGTPLITPEGYKIGTFCICDSEARPGGLTADQRSTFQDLAALVVRELGKRRSKIRQRAKSAEWLAHTAHEFLTPFSGVQLSLNLLQEDDELKAKLSRVDRQRLERTAHCSNDLVRVCEKTIDSLRQEQMKREKEGMPLEDTLERMSRQQPQKTPFERVVPQLVEQLSNALHDVPKRTPVVLSHCVSSNNSRFFVEDDLPLFRASSNLIGHALKRSKDLEQPGVISFHLSRCTSKTDENQPVLMCECRDRGPDVSTNECNSLFPQSDNTWTTNTTLVMPLRSVATQVRLLRGQCGFRPSAEGKGAVFWFQIPLGMEESVSLPPKRKSQSWGNRSSLISGPENGLFAMLPPISVPTTVASSLPSTITKSDTISVSTTGNSSLSNTVAEPVASSPASNLVQMPLPCDKKPPPSNNTTPGEGKIQGVKPNQQFKQLDIPRDTEQSAQQPASSETPQSLPPACTKIEGKQKTSEAGAQSGRQKRALVIDDSQVIRRMLGRGLERLKFKVDEAEDGRVGLTKMKASVYDVVLCDFLMPVMDGLDCVSQFRSWEEEQKGRPKLYIVGISAHADLNEGQRGIRSGMNEFQCKPVGMPKLKQILQRDGVQSLSASLDTAFLNCKQHGAASTCECWAEKPEKATSLKRPRDQVVSDAQPNGKRLRLSENLTTIGSDNGSRNCLIFSKGPGLGHCTADMGDRGFAIALASEGKEAFIKIQSRFWDVVFVDESSYHEDSKLFDAETYRQWERKNRPSNQICCMIMVSSDSSVPSPDDKGSIVLPPSGFDAVMGPQPIVWSSVESLLAKQGNNNST